MAKEGTDSVLVKIPRHVVQPGVIALLAHADAKYQLTQRERIVLGLLAQTEGLPSGKLASELELEDSEALGGWLGRLVDWGLVGATGRTKARRYYLPPDLLRAAGLDGRTTLVRLEPHRLRALVIEDLERYPDSSISEIHRRVGPEIAQRTLKRAIDALVDEKRITFSGERRWRRYRVLPIDQGGGRGR